MRDYTRISPAFWTGRTGRALRRNPDAQRLALYLLSCPAATMIGVFYVASPTICHEVGLEPEILDALWLVLEQLDFAYYDPETEMVWVPNMAREQLDDVLKSGDRRISGVVRQLDSIRRHRFARAFWDRYAIAFSLASHGEAQGLVGLFAPPVKPMEAVRANEISASKPNTPSSEEQEQEIEQDLDPESPPSFPVTLAPLSPPDQTRDPSAPRTAYGLTNLFGVLWEKRYLRMWQGQPTAARAAATFMDRTPAELDQLGPMIRPALERFFADERSFYVGRAHAFDLFVKDFDAHSGRAPPRRGDVRVGHAMAEVKKRPSGEVPL